ncbi:MAG: hypothetical protein LBF71_02690 [Campylobacteraceae bacterium]|jgi:hypothetical protein|nr:hypothetical protein [Campylobacteraceae bacterium]
MKVLEFWRFKVGFEVKAFGGNVSKGFGININLDFSPLDDYDYVYQWLTYAWIFEIGLEMWKYYFRFSLGFKRRGK